MCNIIYVPSKQDLDIKTIKKSWENNNDGAGIIAMSRGGTKIIKGIMDLDLLIKRLDSLPDDSEIAIHLRFGTHGLKRDKSMTHPFKIREGLWLMHNGVLSDFECEHRPNWSDSAILAKDLARVPLSGVRRILDSLHGKFLIWRSKGFEVFGDFKTESGMLQSAPPITYSYSRWSQSNTGVYSKDLASKWGDTPALDTPKEPEEDSFCKGCYMETIDCLCEYVGEEVRS